MREERPAVTGERRAEIRSVGTWDSALTTDEFAAIRSVGFEPVGQVFGAAVYSAVNRVVCPGWPGVQRHRHRGPRRGRCARARERDCPVQVGRRDHIAEASLIGTAIARFSPAGQPGAGPALAIMSLDPQRRQAARIRV